MVYKVKDTGNRTKFETGSHKDLAKGRGRFDLLPLDTLAIIYMNEYDNTQVMKFLSLVDKALKAPEVLAKMHLLSNAVVYFIDMFLDISLEVVVKKLAVLYEAGAEKYEARDWEKGRPMEVFINSTLRHFFQYLNKEDDEDHATAVVWNLVSCMNTLDRLPSTAYTVYVYKEEK